MMMQRLLEGGFYSREAFNRISTSQGEACQGSGTNYIQRPQGFRNFFHIKCLPVEFMYQAAVLFDKIQTHRLSRQQ